MPIAAKISLMNRTEKAIGSIVTAEELNTIMKAVADLLQEYDVFEIAGRESGKDDLLECYLDALKVEGRSPKTLERYEYVIRRLMRALGVPTRQVTVYHVRGYLSAEQKRGISEGTLDGIRQVFSAYFGWLHREGLIERDPMGNIGTIKGQKKQKQIYTPVEIEKLNERCADLRYTERNKAIISFLKSTGCRISEMTGLDRKAVDLQTLQVVVLGKGNKQRKVYMDEVAGMMLAKYLETRTDSNPALFVGAKGERLTPGGVRAMLKELAGRAGVEHVHPHKFRRTLATNLQRRGMPIQEVAHILGHETLDTTMKYVMVDQENTRHDYRRFA